LNKNEKGVFMKQIKTIILAQLALLVILLCISAPAWANLAANTKITNTAILSYSDGGPTPRTVIAHVDVTVTLKPAAVTVTAGSAQSGAYGGPCLPDTFWVTSKANGPDTYNYYMTITASTNTTGPTVTPTSASPSSVTLGGTVTTVGSTASVIVVPADGVNDGQVNGIMAGDKIVIDTTGEEATVLSVNDNLSGTSDIVLSSALTGAVPGAGVQIGERKNIGSTVCSGTIITSGTDITVSDNATVTSTTSPNPSATSVGSVLNTFASGLATLTKYVRNISNPSGTGTPYGYGGNNYYATDVKAIPGETLEYILVSTNTSPSAVSQAFVTDAVPTAYVTFKSDQYSGAADIVYVGNAASPSPVYLTETSDSDQGQYSASTLTVYIGTGATSSAGGTLGAGITALVLYQVTVK
jgi:hypothetical protein